MQFIKNLWKTQPNTVLGVGAAVVMIGGFGVISYLGGSSERVLKKCNEGSMISCYEVPKFLEKEITNPKWVSKMKKINDKQKEEEKNAISIPVKKYRLTAQQVVDKYEIGMRWDCEDAIKSQLVDKRSYKAVKVRYTPHIMNEHPDAVVDVRISFDAKNSFGGNAPSFGRCAFDSNGKMVRSPNVVSGY